MTTMLKRANLIPEGTYKKYRWDIINQISQEFYWHKNAKGDYYQVVQKHELNKGTCRRHKNHFFLATVKGWKVEATFYSRDGRGRTWFYVTRIKRVSEPREKSVSVPLGIIGVPDIDI